MKLNKGINKDLDYTNQLPSTYRSAKNVVLSKDGDRLESEPGGTRIQTYTEYEKLIGKIEASNEIVTFVIDSNTDTLKIYRYKANTVTLVLNTTYFTFSIDSPIQGEYKYNYKGELVILFYSDIDIPRILNLDNLGFDLDSNLELVSVNDEIFTRQFTQFVEPNIVLTAVNANNGNLLSGIYQLCIQYKLPDDSYTNYSLLTNPIPVYKFNPKDDWYNIYANEGGISTNKSITVKISNIDTNFKIFRFGIVYKNNSETKAYYTNDYAITGSEINISDINSFTDTTLDSILVDSIKLNRIGATSTINNILYSSNIETEEDIKYQKYACNITSEFVYSDEVLLDQYEGSYKNEVVLYTEKSFMPFEVYAYYIRFIRTSDNSVTNSFHIPGQAVHSSLKLQSTSKNETDIYNNAKLFHFRDYSDAFASGNNMGFWENEGEYYPVDDEFDGTVDYDGNAIPGGISLSGKNVRHHRFPSLRGLSRGFNFVEAKGDYVNNVTIQLSNPKNGSNNCEFTYLNSTPNIGEFTTNSFKNTTSSTLNGNLNISYKFRSSDQGGKCEIHIYTLDSSGAFKTAIYDHSGTSTTFDYPSIEGSGNENVILLTNETLVINMFRRNISNNIKGSISYSSGYNIFNYNSTTSISIPDTIVSKKLGIKFSNIYIPQYIKDTCSHFEILYAERTTSNMSVLGYGYTNTFDSDATTPDYSDIRTYPFDILANKPSLNVSHLKQEVNYDTNVLTLSSVEDEPTDSFYEVYPTSKAKYVLRDIGYGVPDNVNADEKLYLKIDAYANPTFTNNTISSIHSFKVNAYSTFTNQSLVRTGKLIPIISSGTTDSGSVYGGDSIINLHGVTTYNQDGWTIGDNVRYYLLPVFSVSNIGYRYNDESDISKVFYPKYNLIDGIEGVGVTYSGQYNSSSRLAEAIKLINESYEYIYTFDEYYGYQNIINSVNNTEANIVFNPDNNFIHTFPYRIYRSIGTPTESLIESWRTILATQYYDSVYNKGAIAQLDTDGKDLLIEHENALFVIKSLNELQINEGVVASLGNTDIFDALPLEIIATDGGYVGCQSKFASFRCKFGNVIVDRQQGKIFLYNNYQVDEISKYGLRKWFGSNLEYSLDDVNAEGVYLFDDSTDVLFDDDTTVIYATAEEILQEYLEIDNPYNDLGLIASYDEKFERILFTKNNNAINSIYSWTLSYYPTYKIWVSFHSYIPNIMVYNRNGFYIFDNFINNGMFKLSNSNTYGNFFDNDDIYETSILPCFAQPYKVDKHLLSVEWSTDIESESSKDLYNITFRNATIVTRNQHSDIIPLNNYTFNTGNIRNTNGTWKLNDFMNILNDQSLEILDNLAVDELLIRFLNTSQIVTNWYDKSPIVNPYILVNLEYNNIGNLLKNTGAIDNTDWIDTNDDGLADGIIESVAALGNWTSSISTGNGFKTNYQQINSIKTSIYECVFRIYSIYNTFKINAGTLYYYKLKYRSNCNFGIGEFGAYPKPHVTISSNTGSPIEISGSFTTNSDNNDLLYFTIGWFATIWGGTGRNNGDWFQIDEIYLSTQPFPTGDKIIINDVSVNNRLTPRI